MPRVIFSHRGLLTPSVTFGSINLKLLYASIMQCLLLKNRGGGWKYKSKSVKYLTPSEVNHPTTRLKEELFCRNISKSAIFKGKKIKSQPLSRD